MMKNPIYLFLLLLISPLFVVAQKPKDKMQRELTPARGHYKQLQKFNNKPSATNEEIDKLKFETDPSQIERRLSLKPIFLTDVKVDDFKLPEMPANSSEQTRMELNYLLGLQKQRTPEDVRTSLYMANVYYNLRVKPTDSTYSRFRRNLFFIGRSIGTWFHPDSLPKTANLIASVWQDANHFIWALKFKYARIRPCKIDPAIKNLEVTEWAAYPSGHSANSYINAYIYQELAPEFTDFFIKDAYDMAHSREIIGVHFPSDSESSRIFARQFVNKLFQNEKFRAEFEVVRKEWVQKAREKLTN
jgi:acid phosphatase (class A)